jgi:biotin carboxyl carrier protein
MTFEVEVAGRTRTIAVERTDRSGRFRVIVDGQPHLLDITRTGDFVLSVLASVPFSPSHRSETGAVSQSASAPRPGSQEIAITPMEGAGQLLVHFQGRTATVTVNGRRAGHAADAGAHSPGEISIAAPMPGRVVRVLVGAGDEVGARQGVVVVEAMKMENELRAPRAGRVKEVCVGPGTSVEAGRILAVIE